jgi:creatinine amidohydrolase
VSWTKHLAELSWEQFRDVVPARYATVLVPVGTIEAHGALPLGTDTLIPAAIAEQLAPRLAALIAPAVPYGVTNSLLPYPGSTTVSSETFRAYLFEATAGLADAGFRRIVLLNGHGGQSSEVADVVRRLWAERKVFSVAVEWWGVVGEITREVYGEIIGGHAGVEETAMVVAIAPQTVDAARVAKVRRMPIRAGVRARPFPATVMLERPEKAGEGAPNPDPAKAADFYRRTVDAVESALEDVFAGWDEIRR